MDKVMKAEIEKVFMGWSGAEQIDTVRATKEITTLIIKWLESKKVNFVPEDNEFPSIANSKIGRNQLITELIGGVRK